MSYKRSAIRKLSENLLATAVDMALVSIFYSWEFATSGYRRVSDADRRAHEDWEKFNYQSLKRAFCHLRRKGLIQTYKEKSLLPEITAQGYQRLQTILPQYDEKRVWDGNLYLVTYDIPITHNNQRNVLRDFLKDIGCGMLQHSVWLTPYNPTKLIEDFTDKKDLSQLILVSSLGKDGMVADMELEELMEKVYPLDDLNRRYDEFLLEAGQGKLNKQQLIFRYLAILEDDPQLPLELLPEHWLGEKAYRLFQKLTGKDRQIPYARA